MAADVSGAEAWIAPITNVSDFIWGGTWNGEAVIPFPPMTIILLGIGISHPFIVEGMRGHVYEKPVTTMKAYLRAMADIEYSGPPLDEKPLTVIAALGPKMLEVAATMADGAHPFATTPDHTAQARAVVNRLVEAVLLPVYAVMLDFSALSWNLMLIIFLGTLGFAVVGTLFSAMAVQTRSREIMLPVLFFPVLLPVIIAAVEASTRAVGGETFIGLGRWLPLIGVFDALFLVICPWVFSFVVEE